MEKDKDLNDDIYELFKQSKNISVKRCFVLLKNLAKTIKKNIGDRCYCKIICGKNVRYKDIERITKEIPFKDYILDVKFNEKYNQKAEIMMMVENRS